MKVRDCFYVNPLNNTNKYTDFINYIDTSSVVDGALLSVSLLEDDFPSRAQRLVKKDDILYSSVRPNLRHYYHYVDNYEHVVASTGFVLLRNKSDYLTRFAFYFLKTDEIVKHLSNIAELSQATFPSFSPKDIGKIDLPDFLYEQQQTVVNTLSKYDELIDVNNKRIKILEQTAEELYKEWFVRFRFPCHETAQFENGIPKGWKIEKCKYLMPILTGKKDANYGDEGGKYPFFTCAQEPIKAPDYSFDCSAVLLAGNCDLNVKIYKGRFEAYQRTYVLSPFDEAMLYVLYYTVKDNVEELKQSSTGAAINFITKGMIERIRVIIPNRELLVAFNEILDCLFSQKKVLAAQNESLTKQRDLLLPRLMSGKLEV